MEAQRAVLWAVGFLMAVAMLLWSAGSLLLGSRYSESFSLGTLTSIAMGICLTRYKGKWRPFAMLVCSGVFLLGWSLWFSRGPGVDELESDGDALVSCLEDFHPKTGRYPESLHESGCTPSWNRFGGWKYEALEGGASCHLWVGDYGMDDFILYRYTDSGDWEWDQ